MGTFGITFALVLMPDASVATTCVLSNPNLTVLLPRVPCCNPRR